MHNQTVIGNNGDALLLGKLQRLAECARVLCADNYGGGIFFDRLLDLSNLLGGVVTMVKFNVVIGFAHELRTQFADVLPNAAVWIGE